MAGIFFKPDEKQQSRKNLKIDKDGVAALRARHRQMNPMQLNLTQQLLMRHSQMNPMRGSGNLSGPWGGPMPPGLGLLAAEMMGLQAQPPKQQNTQMRNPFFGGDLIVRQGQQNTQMGNPGYDPWRLQIDSKVAKKLEDQPVGLFF